MEKNSFGTLLGVALLVAVIAGFSSGNTGKESKEMVQDSPVTLLYNYPMETPVRYMNTNKVIQMMDIEGQSIQVNVNSAFGCSIRQTGMQEGNFKLEIQIDTIGQIVDSPQGYAGGSVDDVKGKLFNMIISPKGKEVDVSEAEKVVYNIQGSGETNALQNFLDFFPDLPSGAVRPGDKWDSNDSLSVSSPAMSMKMIVNSVNKYEGIEKTDGIDCAKITSTLTGTRSMSTQSEGMEVYTSGSFTGASTLLFAVKEGYFVSQTITTRMTGNIEIFAPQAMTFPLVMDMTSVVEVKK